MYLAVKITGDGVELRNVVRPVSAIGNQFTECLGWELERAEGGERRGEVRGGREEGTREDGGEGRGDRRG
jgi:hypothetical protein